MKHRKHLQSGVTLLELIVVITILAIITSLATPSFLQWRHDMEAKRIRNLLTSVLRQAKTYSYITRQDLILCLATATGQCHKNAQDKLLIFKDNNSNKHFDSDTDTLLSADELTVKFATLHLRAGNRHYIKFFGDSGKPRGHFGHIKYCPTSKDAQMMYQISFNQLGIIKVKPYHQHPTGC